MKDNKVLSWDRLKKTLDRLKKGGKTIVFTNGCFDILHVGHVRYLNEAKNLGDLLVLGLNSDASIARIKGALRPIVPQDERAAVMAALESVDFITFFDDDTPLSLIEYLEPHILVKGGDWAEEDVVGRESVQKGGGKVVIIPETKGASTTNIIEKIRRIYSRS